MSKNVARPSRVGFTSRSTISVLLRVPRTASIAVRRKPNAFACRDIGYSPNVQTEQQRGALRIFFSTAKSRQSRSFARIASSPQASDTKKYKHKFAKRCCSSSCSHVRRHTIRRKSWTHSCKYYQYCKRTQRSRSNVKQRAKKASRRYYFCRLMHPRSKVRPIRI